MYIGSHAQYPLFLPVLMKLKLSKNTQISNVMKIRPVGAKIFHADERTDTTKVTVAFRSFANAPEKG
jgi:hypothetical protein